MSSKYVEGLVKLVEELGVVRKGNFQLSSGGYSNWKFAAEIGLANAEFAEIVGRWGGEKFHELYNKYDCGIATVDTGGTEFLKKCLPYLTCKDYVVVNKYNKVTGNLNKKVYAIFEDVITKGKSVIRVANVMKSYDCDSVASVVMFVREEEGRQFIKSKGIEVHAILEKSDISHLI